MNEAGPNISFGFFSFEMKFVKAVLMAKLKFSTGVINWKKIPAEESEGISLTLKQPT